MNRRWGVIVVVYSVVVMVLVVAVASSAHASDEGVSLSHDGHTWHESLSESLFDPGIRWVPGDRATTSFYVRNGGDGDAQMSIDVLAEDSDLLLAEDDIDIDVRVGEGDWQPLATGGTTTLTRSALPEGATTQVHLRVGFAWHSPNRSQDKALPLKMSVTLTQTGPGKGGPGGGGPGAGPGGVLPDAGAQVPPWLVWLAAVLVGVGAASLVAGRKEQNHG